MDPVKISNEWLEEERKAGSPYPNGIILATTSADGKPHSRVVDLRLFDHAGALFFTQKISRKVQEIHANPHASMTLWLPLKERQINLEGMISPLTEEENDLFWSSYPRERQLRFCTYASLSGEVIDSPEVLDNRYLTLKEQYQGNPIPLSPDYKGFRLIPEVIYFYEFLRGPFSRRWRYRQDKNREWITERLSP